MVGLENASKQSLRVENVTALFNLMIYTYHSGLIGSNSNFSFSNCIPAKYPLKVSIYRERYEKS